MIGITGKRSTIAQEFWDLMPVGEMAVYGTAEELPLTCDRYLLCAGFLAGQRVNEQSKGDVHEAWEVNFRQPARLIELLIAANDRARICVIGSDSATTGSFDSAYAGAKAAMHLLIETRRLRTPHQQLVGIAPGIIADSGMTTRRKDAARLESRQRMHPKQRFASAVEVARLARFLLYEDSGYVTGTVIRINGGVHTWR